MLAESSGRGAADNQGEVMAKYFMLLAVLGVFVSANLGCEAKVDDDGAKVDIDTDK